MTLNRSTPEKWEHHYSVAKATLFCLSVNKLSVLSMSMSCHIKFYLFIIAQCEVVRSFVAIYLVDPIARKTVGHLRITAITIFCWSVCNSCHCISVSTKPSYLLISPGMALKAALLRYLACFRPVFSAVCTYRRRHQVIAAVLSFQFLGAKAEVCEFRLRSYQPAEKWISRRPSESFRLPQPIHSSWSLVRYCSNSFQVQRLDITVPTYYCYFCSTLIYINYHNSYRTREPGLWSFRSNGHWSGT